MTDLPDATEPAWLRGLITRRGEPSRYIAEDGAREWSWDDYGSGVSLSPNTRGWTTVTAWSPGRRAYLDVLGDLTPADVSGVITQAGLDGPLPALLDRLAKAGQALTETRVSLSLSDQERIWNREAYERARAELAAMTEVAQGNKDKLAILIKAYEQLEAERDQLATRLGERVDRELAAGWERVAEQMEGTS